MTKLWHTEEFILNFHTGEMMKRVTEYKIEAINFEHAQLELLESGKEWLRLSGSYEVIRNSTSNLRDTELPFVFDDSPKEFEGFEEGGWDEFSMDSKRLLKRLTLDSLYDFLDTLTKHQVDVVWKECVRHEMAEKVGMVEGYIKNRYGK